MVFLPDIDAYDDFRSTHFQTLHDQHWQIEQYHRMIKQLCHIEKFQVRGQVPIRNPIFAALCSYVHLQQMKFVDMISNAYPWQCHLYTQVVAAFVRNFMQDKQHLNPQFQSTVNA